MALREVADDGRVFDVPNMPHQSDFERVWLAFTQAQRDAMEAEIGQRLDQLIASPNPNWGAITNTSIERGKANALTGVKGDWSGTVFQPIFVYFGDEQLAGMFYGNVWKKVIIERAERWISASGKPQERVREASN